MVERGLAMFHRLHGGLRAELWLKPGVISVGNVKNFYESLSEPN